ncbi:MAG: heme ABC exporter ATP-binding protein CcmA [Thermoflexales bacterium]|nr:heme ABC exporter ATP-binding protein CcmA [Thermoflexales bacterium]
MNAVEVENLSKSFGPHIALAGITLSIGVGEFVTLVGPNGAGKTTLLRILATLIRPSSGALRIAGLDPAREGAEIRRRIGFLSHRTLLYDDLTAEQNLLFYARLYGLPDAPARVDELLGRVGLADRRHDRVRTFSRGMQQRLAVARAVLHRPSILLLDEPYTGLDPHAADALSGLLGELAGEGCTIFLTTHDLERGLAAGDRVVVLSRGRVVYDTPTSDIDPAAFPSIYRRLTGG